MFTYRLLVRKAKGQKVLPLNFKIRTNTVSMRLQMIVYDIHNIYQKLTTTCLFSAEEAF